MENRERPEKKEEVYGKTEGGVEEKKKTAKERREREKDKKDDVNGRR